MDRKIEKKTFTAKNVVLYGGLIAVVAFVAYQFIWADTSSRLNVNLERLTVSTVEMGEFQEFIPVNGTVIPIRTIYLDMVEGGRVERLYVDGGELVRAGDTLLVLGNNNLQLDVLNRESQTLEQINNLQNTRLALQQERLSLRNQVLTLETDLLTRRRNYERDKALMDRQLISEHQYLESKQLYEQILQRRDLVKEQISLDSLATENQLRFIDASLVRMQSNLKLVTRSTDYLIVRAPVTGQLTTINAEIGENKNRGERIGQIDVLDGYKVRVGIDEHYISRIQNGQSGSFDFAGQSYTLTISKIYPEVREGRFEVDMDFTGSVPEGIRRGQTLRVRLAIGDFSEAMLLPRGGFFQATGGNWVFVLDEGGQTASRRPIRIGRQSPIFYEILDGLQPGERVITSSYDTFGDNERLILQ